MPRHRRARSVEAIGLERRSQQAHLSWVASARNHISIQCSALRSGEPWVLPMVVALHWTVTLAFSQVPVRAAAHARWVQTPAGGDLHLAGIVR